MTVALVMAAGMSLAKPPDAKDKTTAKPLWTVDGAYPTEGLMESVSAEDGEIKVEPSSPQDGSKSGSWPRKRSG